MFDERTLELFKIKNHVKGDIDIISFSSYINKYIAMYLGLTMRYSILGSYC